MKPELKTMEAKNIYMALLDYYIMCGDPLYRRLCKFANQILSVKDSEDKAQLVQYFEYEERKSISYFKNPNA